LDEIEKAHPDVFNMLLQVLDDGYLTDSLGQIDFKKHDYYHDFKCGIRQLKDFGQGVGFGTAKSGLTIIRKHYRKRIEKTLLLNS
jgi:ATP-dependent Clp protease ATP-binding subunit ClpC